MPKAEGPDNKSNSEIMRLDQWLVKLAIAPSRTKAQEIITSGHVFLNSKALVKANVSLSEKQAQDLFVRAQGILQFVSRGGIKLAGALDHLKFSVKGLKCLDAGSSTGGFSHCLLERGAQEVLGFDVGHGQIHSDLTEFSNFHNIEGVNIKEALQNSLIQEFVSKGVDLVVVDLSFISIIKVVDYLPDFLTTGGHLLTLIKPQFELPPKSLNKKGVVKNESEFVKLEDQVKKVVSESGLSVIDYFPSPLRGKDGNQEFFLFAKKV